MSNENKKWEFSVGCQTWRHLFFMHWIEDPEHIQKTLPRGLTVDAFEGNAYLGIIPFSMERVRPRFLPPVPGLSWFLELNVRTYVRDQHQRQGVYFYSLDCNQPLAVNIARRAFHLPYQHAEMATNFQGNQMAFSCRRRSSDLTSNYQWQAMGDPAPAKSDSLEHFLVERYLLFTAHQKSRKILLGRVSHAPYRLTQARNFQYCTQPLKQAGFNINSPPISAIYAEPVNVNIFPLREVNDRNR